jgi:LuxR family maltose regulon positive regulatory protein
LWPEAVGHALAAGELAHAAQWAENCAMEMLERGDPHALLRWIGKLPPDAVQGRLRLRLAKAWALAFSLQTARASREIAAVADEFNQARRDESDEAGQAALAEINAISALVAAFTDDSERAFELGRAAESSTEPALPWVKRYAQTAQFFGLMYKGRFEEIRRIWDAASAKGEQRQELNYSDMLRDATYGLAALLYGELREARRVFEVTFRRAEETLGHSSAGAAGLAGCLASIYYEHNELPEARKIIAGRTTIALETAPLGALVRYTLSVARLLWRDGATGPALAILEDGRQVAINRQWLRLKLACDAETVRLLIHSGDVTKARQIADELIASVPAICEGRAGSAVETWTSYCLVQARVLIAEDLADEAVTFLARSLDTLAAMGWRHSEAVVSLLLSVAFEQCGAFEKSLAALKQALRLGREIGLINSFVDEGERGRALLLRFRRASTDIPGAQMAYVDTLLAAFDALDNSPGASLSTVRMMTTSLDVLSARELEIINYVARGLSNKEIGRSLKVAPETVKWHLKNIFEKLNVSSRTEAVQSVFGPGVGEGRADM